MVAWAMLPAGQVKISGTPRTYKSSEHGQRQFCGECGTNLFYINEQMLPGLIDVQTGTLDDPNALPAQAHIQTADEIGWMKTAHELPRFERYPG